MHPGSILGSAQAGEDTSGDGPALAVPPDAEAPNSHGPSEVCLVA